MTWVQLKHIGSEARVPGGSSGWTGCGAQLIPSRHGSPSYICCVLWWRHCCQAPHCSKVVPEAQAWVFSRSLSPIGEKDKLCFWKCKQKSHCETWALLSHYNQQDCSGRLGQACLMDQAGRQQFSRNKLGHSFQNSECLPGHKTTGNSENQPKWSLSSVGGKNQFRNNPHGW